MSKHVWEQEAECGSCKGTGLCVCFAENSGAAVVCHTCKGTGKVTLRTVWRDFEGRKQREGIKRVLACNPGVGIGEGECDGETFRLEYFGGLTVAEWEAGAVFGAGAEMRRFTCPAWWWQTQDYNLKPSWDECIVCGSFSGCKHFPDKAECWDRWDADREAGVDYRAKCREANDTPQE